MKKAIIIALACAALPVCAQDNEAYRVFNSVAKAVKGMEYCHVSVHSKNYFGWSDHPTYEWDEAVTSVNSRTLKGTTILQTANDEEIVVNGKGMTVLDMDRKLFMQFKKNRREDSEFVSWQDRLNLNTINMIACYAPWMDSFRGSLINKPVLSRLTDTLVVGIRYTVIHGDQTFPNRYRLTYYYNNDSRMIERLVKDLADSSAMRSGVPTRVERTFTVSTDCPADDIAAKYDPQNTAYQGFEFSDDSGIDLGDAEPVVGERLSDAVLDHPLLGLDGSERTLREMGGYLLLDFFNNYCSPCFRFMSEQADEARTRGTTRLAECGITTVSLNPMSRNVDLTRSKVGEWSPAGSVFVCYGLLKNIRIRAYPTFILLSPDKEVLLVTNMGEGDYIGKIIQAALNDSVR